MASLTDWLEAQSDRVAARQRAEIETAKLLSTFAAGVAAAIVGTAFQVEADNVSRWTIGGAAALLVGIGAVLVLVLSDVRREVNHEVVLNTASQLGLSDQDKVAHLQTWVIAGVTLNERLVKRTRIWLYLSTAASMAAVVLGLVSLLR